jgi:hypothetical protein
MARKVFVTISRSELVSNMIYQPQRRIQAKMQVIIKEKPKNHLTSARKSQHSQDVIGEVWASFGPLMTVLTD